MKALCAFPRSGGTLLSAILTNHPDVVVSSEFFGGKKQLPQSRPDRSWEANIAFVSDKFHLRLNASAPLGEIDKILTKANKHLIYRVWVPGYLDDLRKVRQHLGRDKRIVLLRSFAHIALSLYDARRAGRIGRAKQVAERTWNGLWHISMPDEFALAWLAKYEAFADYVASIQDRLVLYYEDLVSQPHRELGRLCDYLGLDTDPLDACLHFNFAARGGRAKTQPDILSGDRNIRATTGIRPATNYPEWRISDRLRTQIGETLARYPEYQRYLESAVE